MGYKTILRELLWFIEGSTDNKKLQDKNVHIWDANASKEFLGNSLEEIAREKAGIIKYNTPVVIGEKNPKIRNLFNIRKNFRKRWY